ncbi:response regulator [Candidatus Daviesbacteria bacterium]|nr:response regulator [Candidatus Daviesbacteria bacterium]
MKKKSILVIDDDNGIVTALKFILEDVGYTAVVMDNLKLLNSVDLKDINLVLVDLLLSGIDGKLVVKKIKEKNKTLPIIMLSAHPSAKEQAMQAGVDDFLAKPFNIDELLALVKKYTSK